MRRFFLTASFAASLFVSSCHHPAHVEKTEVTSVEMNAAGSYHDSAVAAIIAPYKVQLDKEMNEILGVSDQAMVKDKDKLESLLGNFTADIVLESAKKNAPRADICLLNSGGLRTSLPKGDLTRGKIFELMPFDNEIVVVWISGSKMKELLDFVAFNTGMPVAGMKLGVHDLKPTTMMIGDQPFDETKTYAVATSDYLANGGDKMNFFKNPVKTDFTKVLIRNAIIDHVKAETKAGKHIIVKTDGRIYND